MDFFAAKNLTMKFGGLVAVNDFNISLKRGEIVGLIGPNGAGKTTVFNMVAAYYEPTEGTITFIKNIINGKKANEIKIRQRGCMDKHRAGNAG